MATKKPIKRESGKNKEFAATDTIAVNNLAPSGNNGEVLVKDDTTTDGKKWFNQRGFIIAMATAL